MKILVTGFSPFLGEAINPTQKIVETLTADGSLSSVADFRVLPVSFARSVSELLSVMNSGSYRSLLMLGQARGRTRLNLERVALNWIETEHPDEDGQRPERGEILPGGPPAILCPLPLEDWRSKLQVEGIPTEVSLSAGGYVCNHLLFHACQAYGRDRCSVLFTHVPLLPEQARDGEPSMELSVMLRGVRRLISWL